MKPPITAKQDVVFQVSLWSLTLTFVLASPPSYSFTIIPTQPGASIKYDKIESSFSKNSVSFTISETHTSDNESP